MKTLFQMKTLWDIAGATLIGGAIVLGSAYAPSAHPNYTKTGRQAFTPGMSSASGPLADDGNPRETGLPTTGQIQGSVHATPLGPRV